MGDQIAKLLIRGTLPNVTAKDLTPQQLEEVGRVCIIAYEDPQLKRALIEFCAALGRTIATEYKDQSFGRQEAMIAYWLAAVDILHHRPKKHLKKLLESTCSDCNTICTNKVGEPDPKKTCVCGSRNKLTDKFEIAQTSDTLDLMVSDEIEIDGIIGKVTEVKKEANPPIFVVKFSKDDKRALPMVATEARVWRSIIMLTADQAEERYEKATGNPAPERDRSIIENKIQRKKFFQTYLFNRLRQILRENTFETSKQHTTIRDHADKVAFRSIRSILTNTKNKIDFEAETLEREFSFKVDTNQIPLKEVYELGDLKDNMSEYGINITIEQDLITAKAEDGDIPIVQGSIIEKNRVHGISLDSFNDDDDQGGFNEHIQTKGTATTSAPLSYKDIELSDSAKVVRDRLDEKGQQIFDLITNPSDAYVARFGSGKICKAHVAKFLGISPKQVNHQWTIIELQCHAVGLTP
jgi:hypothetical protein